MKIFTTVNPNSITNIYFITDDNQDRGVIIDPGSFTRNVYNLVNQTGAEVRKIIITHNEPNQIDGIPIIKRIWDVPIFAHNSSILDYSAERVNDGDIIEEGSLRFTTIETPSHTYDSLSFLIENSIFVGGIIEAGVLSSLQRQHNPTEVERRIVNEKIFSLPDTTIIYPSRGPATTVEIEKKFNPYFTENVEELYES